MRLLTTAECMAITKPGFYRADDTLYLRVKPSGRRPGIQRVLVDCRRHDFGLGAFPVLSLRMARELAFDNRRAIVQGRNPMLEKRRTTIPVFKVAAETAYAVLSPQFRSAQHTRDWMNILRRHAFPNLGNKPVDRLSHQDVLKILTPIWIVRTETARRVRLRNRAVLDHCRVHGYLAENVADDRINAALPKIPKIKSSLRALEYRKMPGAMKQIETEVVSLPARLCLLFEILTAVQSNESCEATWREFTLKPQHGLYRANA